MRPFRFAITFRGPTSAEKWTARARRAEELGYATFLMPDHTGKQFSVVPALAAVAAATTRLRVGSFVFANDFRNPVLLAKEVATLDVLSGGRVDFGLGAGWARADYRRLGLPYDAPGVRVSRFREALGLMRRLWTEDAVDHAGRFYTVRGANVLPKPVQRPLPLMIGGGGPRMLGLSARHADVVALLPQFDARGRPKAWELTAAHTARKVARVREAAGERFERLELNAIVFDAHVTDGAALLPRAATLPKRLIAGLTGTPYAIYGSRRDIAETLRRRRDALGISYYAIPGTAMENFAPIVDALAGR